MIADVVLAQGVHFAPLHRVTEKRRGWGRSPSSRGTSSTLGVGLSSMWVGVRWRTRAASACPGRV